MYSHFGSVTTQDTGFRTRKWSVPLLLIFICSLIFPTTPHSLHLQSLLLLRQAFTFSNMVILVARTSVRQAANFISHGGYNGPGQSTAHRLRNGAPIRHASTNIRPPPNSGLHRTRPLCLNSFFFQARNFFTQIFNARVPTHCQNMGTTRSLHSGATPTIKSGLSFHARTALSSGLRHHLPRPPSVGVHVTTNVGLGLARNFSTARPIFQNIVDNVPVVCRAFYEADLDLRKGHVKRPRNRPSIQNKTKEVSKPHHNTRAMSFLQDNEAEIARYFDDYVAPVTTYLLVPLAPTPSSRVPLSEEPVLSMDMPMLLPPLSLLQQHHASFQRHAARVSSLFLRLNQASVWSKGASCSSYSYGGEDVERCTILTVEFTGWSEAEVRAVIGEGGTDWCEIIERKSDNADADESSEWSTTEPDETADVKDSEHNQVSSSFVMPTIDLSSPGFESSLSFPSPDLSLSSMAFSSRPMSPFSGFDDPWSDTGLENNVESRNYGSSSERSSERSWQRVGILEFSARHLSHRNSD